MWVVVNKFLNCCEGMDMARIAEELGELRDIHQNCYEQLRSQKDVMLGALVSSMRNFIDVYDECERSRVCVEKLEKRMYPNEN